MLFLFSLRSFYLNNDSSKLSLLKNSAIHLSVTALYLNLTSKYSSVSLKLFIIDAKKSIFINFKIYFSLLLKQEASFFHLYQL